MPSTPIPASTRPAQAKPFGPKPSSSIGTATPASITPKGTTCPGPPEAKVRSASERASEASPRSPEREAAQTVRPHSAIDAAESTPDTSAMPGPGAVTPRRRSRW